MNTPKKAMMILMGAAIALQSDAALKYEPDSYVQDGLVLQLDGIRNVGALKAHDATATTWVNLVDSGRSVDLMKRSGHDDDSSAWTSAGYHFAGYSYGITQAALPAMSKVTIEVSGDFDKNTPLNSGNPNYIAIRDSTEFSVFTANGADTLQFKDDSYGASYSTRPKLDNWGHKNFSCVLGESTASIYQDGESSVTKGRSEVKEVPSKQYVIANGGGDGDINSTYTRQTIGTFNSVRIYSRPLTADEVLQNYNLDQVRFVTGIPVTNAVVATSIAGAEGVESSGVYAVDGSHVFAANASAKVGEVTYVCTGYTLEKWKNGAWGTAEAIAGFSCSVSDDEKVRITWQWSVAEGSLSSGYVTDGLVLWYDGIWNAGFGAHDNGATRWKDLSGAGNDGILYTTGDTTYGTPGWTGSGYSFFSNAWFDVKNTVNPGREFALQVVADFDSSASGLSPYPMIFFADRNANGNTYFFQGYYNKGDKKTYLNADKITGNGSASRSCINSWNNGYLTAVFAQTSTGGCDTWLFDGTTYPTGATGFYAGGAATYNLDTAVWSFGGAPSTAADSYRALRYYTGAINAVRVYSRKLTEAELAQNRAADEAHFKGNGTLSGTPVEVVADVRGLVGREAPGLYFPSNWTFSAGTATQKFRDREYRACGYVVETWDAASSTWRVVAISDSATEWTSPEEPNSAGFRLTWKWNAVYGIRSASDYDVADYVQGGLVLHLDGIRNAGVDVPHDGAATTWKDISYRNSYGVLQKNDLSHWTEDGYYFTNSSAGAYCYVIMEDRLSLGTNGTIEIACDIDKSAQFANYPQLIAFNSDGSKNYDMGVYWDKGASQCRWKADTWSGSNKRANVTEPWDGRHAAFVMDTAQYRSFKNGVVDQTQNRSTATNMPAVYWRLGSKYNSGSVTENQLVGVMKAARAYNRALSDEEVAHNWKVDVARFDGLLTVTNVVVVGKFDNYEGIAPGVYEVDGRYTFTAGPATDEKGKEREVIGYTIEEWNPSSGSWNAPQRYEGDSYTYTVGVDSEKVRLTWKWQHSGLVISFR